MWLYHRHPNYIFITYHNIPFHTLTKYVCLADSAEIHSIKQISTKKNHWAKWVSSEDFYNSTAIDSIFYGHTIFTFCFVCPYKKYSTLSTMRIFTVSTRSPAETLILFLCRCCIFFATAFFYVLLLLLLWSTPNGVECLLWLEIGACALVAYIMTNCNWLSRVPNTTFR